MQIRTRHIGQSVRNDHPAHPVTPSTFETPSITRVPNCFLAQMGVAHKPIAYPSILALHR